MKTPTIAAILALALTPGLAGASDIRVAPVVLDPLPGARTTSLTLTNAENRPVRVQLRVMKWSVENGQEQLTPTDAVVASPPFATLDSQQQYLVRVVRTAKAPPQGEETYRVLVDEVPTPGAAARSGTVELVVRQSIPVFFSDIPRRTPKVAWALHRQDGGAMLVGRNTGNRRLRVADLNIDAGGKPVFSRPGLVGYVLAGSELRIPLDGGQGAIPADGRLRMIAASDTGRVEASLAAQPMPQ